MLLEIKKQDMFYKLAKKKVNKLKDKSKDIT